MGVVLPVSILFDCTYKDSQIYTPRLMYILVKMSSELCMWKLPARSMNVVIFIDLLHVLTIGACWKHLILISYLI